MSIPQPIPYQGSKRQLAPAIADYFPTPTQRLIEPFAGSAALSVYSANTKKIHQFWLNDINEPLIRLWEMLIHNPAQLADQYEHLWHTQMGQERTFYDWVRERFNHSHRPDDLLYLLARCVKAAIRYNTNGEFNQSPDNRRKGRQPDAMRRDILNVAQLLSNVHLTAQDYRVVLSSATKNDVVYMDPPYQGVCASRDPRYFRGIDIEAFIGALDDLNTREIPYLVSYDGRTGVKVFGKPLPGFLHLQRIEISAGRSSQATLLGQKEDTFESLYLSPALLSRLDQTTQPIEEPPYQLPPPTGVGMTQPEFPSEFLALLATVTGKRSRVVVDHILQHGFITTETLEKEYGYNHPPRAIRDVREQGIPIETFSVKNGEGRTIAAYRFGDFNRAVSGRIGGRILLPKRFKNQLIHTLGSKCSICQTPFEDRYLQADHRVPYEVAGDSGEPLLEDYMLVCGACNRAKSWSCEHCDNWLIGKNPALCKTCYWANPEQYEHVALRPIRRLDITWTEAEIHDYESLKESANLENQTIPDYVKRILKTLFESR